MAVSAEDAEVVHSARDEGVVAAAEDLLVCASAGAPASVGVERLPNEAAAAGPPVHPQADGDVVRPVFTPLEPATRRWWTFFFLLRLWTIISKVSIFSIFVAYHHLPVYIPPLFLLMSLLANVHKQISQVHYKSLTDMLTLVCGSYFNGSMSSYLVDRAL